MSTPSAPDDLGAAGTALWTAITGAVASSWQLDGRDLAWLTDACRMADRREALSEAVDRDGLIVMGSAKQLAVHPAVREIRSLTTAIAGVLARVELRAPRQGTRHLDKAGRDQLRDARQRRWQ